MTITRGQAILLLEPKLSRIWFDATQKRPVEWTNYFNIRSTKKATVTDYNMTGFGSLALKGEGQPTQADDPIFGNTKIYQPVRFGLKYGITQETIDHELYAQTAKLETALMDAMYDHQEQLGALWMNSGFGTTNQDGFTATGFDSLQFFSTAHTRLDGGATQRNRPSTDVDLGVTGLQGAIVDFENWKTHRGRPTLIKPQRLVISPEDQFTAQELLKSEFKPGTVNNEINALQAYGLTYMISHYKTDTDAWFLLGDQHDNNWIWDVQPASKMWDDPDAEVIYRKVVYGAVNGHGEWYGAWGTSGG